MIFLTSSTKSPILGEEKHTLETHGEREVGRSVSRVLVCGVQATRVSASPTLAAGSDSSCGELSHTENTLLTREWENTYGCFFLLQASAKP